MLYVFKGILKHLWLLLTSRLLGLSILYQTLFTQPNVPPNLTPLPHHLLSPPFSHPPPPPNPTPPEPPDSEDDVFARLESLKSGIEIVFDHAKSWTKYAKEISNYVEKRNALGLCVYKKYIYIYIYWFSISDYNVWYLSLRFDN